MTRSSLGFVAAVGLVTLLCAPSRASAQVPTSPSLGTAGRYSVLAGTQVTNTGVTTISGNVGVSPGAGAPGTNTPGFGTVVFGPGSSVQDFTPSAQGAMADKNIAYGALDQPCNFTYPGAARELTGNYPPGVHCATSFHLSGGTLTLVGTAADTWIFKSASDLIVNGGAAARVVSPSCNVWWRVVSSASLDAGSSLTGNILADTSITLAAGASISGRALARTGNVTLSSNAISSCVAPLVPPPPAPLLPPSIAKVFTPASVLVGANSRLTVTLSNPNSVGLTLTAAFTDTLPAGVLISATPNATTTCTAGIVTAPIGGSTLTLLAGAVIPSAGFCQMEVNVTATAAGVYINTIPVGALQTTGGANPAPAVAPLTVTAPAAPPVPGPVPVPPEPGPTPGPTPTPTPTPPGAPSPNDCPTTSPDLFIVKRHTELFVVGANATYSIALFNSGSGPSSGTTTVIDTLPAGLTFVSATGVSWACAATGQSVVCTTAAVAAPASPFPNNITVTVRPGASAVPGVTNNAAVTGGGDCNVNNNATADVTLVAAAVPTLSEWAGILLAVLLAAAGVVALRRRTWA